MCFFKRCIIFVLLTLTSCVFFFFKHVSLLLHQLTCRPCEFPAGLNDFVCPIKVILAWTLLSSKTARWTLCQSQAAGFRSKLSRDKGRQVILERFSNQNYRSSSQLLQRCSVTQWILKQPWQWESKLVQSQDPLVVSAKFWTCGSGVC